MQTVKSTTGNIGLTIWRLKCYYETFVQGSTEVILLIFCAKNPPLRKAENRYKAITDFAIRQNSEKLIETIHAWIQVNLRREKCILANIYPYSSANEYERTVLTIGSAHGRSLKQLIADAEKQNDLNLVWCFYKYKTA